MIWPGFGAADCSVNEHLEWAHFLFFEKEKEQSLFLFQDVCRSFRGIRTWGPEEDCLISPR